MGTHFACLTDALIKSLLVPSSLPQPTEQNLLCKIHHGGSQRGLKSVGIFVSSCGYSYQFLKKNMIKMNKNVELFLKFECADCGM